jgi:hypothetical protein
VSTAPYEKNHEAAAALSAISPTDESYNTKLKVLKEDVEHHIKGEKDEMLPDAKKYLGESRLASLGTQMAAGQQQLEDRQSPKRTAEVRDERNAAK